MAQTERVEIADDLVPARSLYALIGALIVGLILWGGALSLII